MDNVQIGAHLDCRLDIFQHARHLQLAIVTVYIDLPLKSTRHLAKLREHIANHPSPNKQLVLDTVWPLLKDNTALTQLFSVAEEFAKLHEEVEFVGPRCPWPETEGDNTLAHEIGDTVFVGIIWSFAVKI